MDPGNWATDLAGGSQFGYRLIWVLLMSNIMALLLQSLSARLGIVKGRDLAQCNREIYPKSINFVLYVLAEIAIAACDLAEVLGMAIGLNLLLGIPLIWGVLITLLDTFLLLYLQRMGMRMMEAFIIALVAIIGLCFLVEIFIAQPDASEIVKGFVPSIPNQTALYIAIGIIGATVMPHNLYLHSALVQTRKIKKDDASIREAIKFNFIDSTIALNAAFLVNAAILILAAAAFFKSGNTEVAALKDAHRLLSPMLGNKLAPHLFAIALIAAGQSSTVTGTLAGQIVMEGYLSLRINPWARRMITRLLAIVPAVLVILIMGEKMVDSMLVFSQVLLSMQLAFAIIPLIHFVSDKTSMGSFVIKPWVKVFAWTIAIIIVSLNLKLVYETAETWIASTNIFWIKVLVVAGEIGLILLLIITFAYPLIRKQKRTIPDIHRKLPLQLNGDFQVKPFKKIALALDFSENDQHILRYAMQLGDKDTSYLLIHIVESASAKLMGEKTEDYETREDAAKLQQYVDFLQANGFGTTGQLGYRNRTAEIARIVKQEGADLLIVGSHGHRGINDLVHGETINRLRHLIAIPLFIAQ